MKPVFAAVLLALALTGPLGAQDSDAEVTFPLASQLGQIDNGLTPAMADEALKDSVRAMSFILFHEVAHMLIHELDLPVLGWEEDAADTLAVYLLVRDPDPNNVPLLSAAIHLFANTQTPFDQLSVENFFSEHSMNLQRAYNAVCIMVGHDPLRFTDLADTLGIPEDQRRKCMFRAERALDSWAAVLKPHKRSAGDPSGAELLWDYQRPETQWQRDLGHVYRQTRILERMGASIHDTFALPRQIQFVAANCGKPNAFYMPDRAAVVICWEKLEQVFALFANEEIRQADAAAPKDEKDN
ncbi:MAG: DUF4344 domain-containing metallopeptidase [Pseudomonadota bacterium]